MNLSLSATHIGEMTHSSDQKRPTTPDWGDSASKKKTRDPTSHRLIEKRRRDRMNTCLQNLSKLIPQDYMRKSRTRMEKTEIVEMAIKRLTELESERLVTSSSQYFPESTLREESERQYKRGVQECLNETIRFLRQPSSGHCSSSSGGSPSSAQETALQLIDHLKSHFEKVQKPVQSLNHFPANVQNNGNHNSCPTQVVTNPPVGPLTTNGTEAALNAFSRQIKSENGSSPSHYHLESKFENLYCQRNGSVDSGQPDPVKPLFRSTSGSFSSTSSSDSNIYGFKKQIKERFQADCELKMDLTGDDENASDSSESTVSVSTLRRSSLTPSDSGHRNNNQLSSSNENNNNNSHKDRYPSPVSNSNYNQSWPLSRDSENPERELRKALVSGHQAYSSSSTSLVSSESSVPGFARHPTEPFYVPIRVRLSSIAPTLKELKSGDHYTLLPVNIATHCSNLPLVTNCC